MVDCRSTAGGGGDCERLQHLVEHVLVPQFTTVDHGGIGRAQHRLDYARTGNHVIDHDVDHLHHDRPHHNDTAAHEAVCRTEGVLRGGELAHV